MNNEPVLTAASLAGLVSALLVLAASFGVPMTEDQRNAILAVVAVVAPIGLGIWARSQVVPTAKVEERLPPAEAQKVLAGE